MKLLSLKAAVIYLSVSVALYSYQFIYIWGRYYEMASQKPVYPLFHYIDQNILTSVNIFMERNILIFFAILILVPFLNLLSFGIAVNSYRKSKYKNLKRYSLVLMVIALMQWLTYFYMRFFR